MKEEKRNQRETYRNIPYNSLLSVYYVIRRDKEGCIAKL